LIPIGQKAVIRVAGHDVEMVVTRRQKDRSGWIMEMEVTGALHESIRSGALVLIGDEQGFVTKIESGTDSIEVTLGPDWRVPARWEPDRHRKFMPGMTYHTMTVRGPA